MVIDREAAAYWIAQSSRAMTKFLTVAASNNRHCEERSDDAIQLSALRCYGLLRGACHRARVGATRWLAMRGSYRCPSSASPPETSTLPGAGSRLSFLTTPSSTSIE